eukprot:6207343-Pleurochrysis_carterae.AAC.1
MTYVINQQYGNCELWTPTALCCKNGFRSNELSIECLRAELYERTLPNRSPWLPARLRCALGASTATRAALALAGEQQRCRARDSVRQGQSKAIICIEQSLSCRYLIGYVST